MSFYLALAFACIIAAVVCLWIFRSMVEIGRTAYRSIIPGAKDSSNEVQLMRLSTRLHETRSPWGWARNGISRVAGKSQLATPWGWPGSSGLHNSNRDTIVSGLENSAAVSSLRSLLKSKTGSESAGDRPRRDKRSGSVTRSRKAKARMAAERAGENTKPWGW